MKKALRTRERLILGNTREKETKTKSGMVKAKLNYRTVIYMRENIRTGSAMDKELTSEKTQYIKGSIHFFTPRQMAKLYLLPLQADNFPDRFAFILDFFCPTRVAQGGSPQMQPEFIELTERKHGSPFAR